MHQIEEERPESSSRSKMVFVDKILLADGSRDNNAKNKFPTSLVDTFINQYTRARLSLKASSQ
jgi:hypothetical protein